MKIHHSGMHDIEEVLDEFKKKYNFENIVKKSTFFKFWDKIVGKKFASKSKPVSINQKNVLTVACENSMVTSELFMFREMILEKIKTYTTPLGLQIEDVIFSHKIWKDETQENNIQNDTEDRSERVSDDELERTKISEEEIEVIKKSIHNIPFADENQKQKMLSAIIKNLKIQKIRATRG